jgi:hypothetical protein
MLSLAANSIRLVWPESTKGPVIRFDPRTGLEESLKGAGIRGTTERANTVRAGMPVQLNAVSFETLGYSKILLD